MQAKKEAAGKCCLSAIYRCYRKTQPYIVGVQSFSNGSTPAEATLFHLKSDQHRDHHDQRCHRKQNALHLDLELRPFSPFQLRNAECTEQTS